MFKNEAESRAWSTFFAAQAPKFVNPNAKNVGKEIEASACAADQMLEEWRKRAEPEAPKRGRQRRIEAPEHAPEGEPDGD